MGAVRVLAGAGGDRVRAGVGLTEQRVEVVAAGVAGPGGGRGADAQVGLGLVAVREGAAGAVDPVFAAGDLAPGGVAGLPLAAAVDAADPKMAGVAAVVVELRPPGHARVWRGGAARGARGW